MTKITGPVSAISRLTHAEKYRADHETFEEFTYRLANSLKDSDEHYHSLVNIIGNQYFLPAGRIQSAMGSIKQVTAFNCFVSMTIEDSSASIMKALAEAFQTMRMGGGIGYNFSKLRPRGAMIKSLASASSGPVSFMRIFDAMCGTVSSSGHRRGAQMGILNIDHPDIEEFIMAKTNTTDFLNFNFSVGVTDKFMEALRNKTSFDLTFDGTVYKTVDAAALWERLMRATWDWAEPGVIFIDRMNAKNLSLIHI
jgi:ribonucleoside-diphosphate reductase alpha chain